MLNKKQKENDNKKVLYNYFNIISKNNKYTLELVKQKWEIDLVAYIITNVYTSDDNNKEILCSICLTEKPNIIFRPCNHFVIDSDCLKTLKQKTKNKVNCPLCRNEIKKYFKIINN